MKKTRSTPPALFLRFFRWFCNPQLRDYIEGDLFELYREREQQQGKRRADISFCFDVLLLCRPGIIRPRQPFRNPNYFAMYKSYFTIGWRNLIKNKGYSTINVTGLALGMAVAVIIGLWVYDELTFNTSFQNRDRLALVMCKQTNNGSAYSGTVIAPPIEDPLRNQYGSHFKAIALTSFPGSRTFSVGDKQIVNTGRWVQPDFPAMFSFTSKYGNLKTLNDPSSMLISSSLSAALFGNADPTGRSVRIDNSFDMTVAGVYDDAELKHSFLADTHFLMPWENTKNWLANITDWNNHSCNLYVQLADDADLATVSKQVSAIPTPYISQWKEELMLYPVAKSYLYGKFENGEPAGGRIQFVWFFSIIGGFVLLLACINFMNLSTARSEKRAKEVGIRKTVGSLRKQLMGQFLTESIVVALAALFLALLLVQLTLPFFNVLGRKDMSIPWSALQFWLLLGGFALFAGILSGSYPAFYLSSFKPVKVLKGTFKAGRSAAMPRKVLVVLQFTVSIALIMGTVVVFRQIQHAKDRSAGYLRSGLITVNINTPDVESHYDVLKEEVLRTGLVSGMSRTSQSPAHFSNNNSLEWPGKGAEMATVFFRNVTVTADFGKTIGWTIQEGRDFSAEILSDSSAMILNETAAALTGLENPIGETVTFNKRTYTIIGIANDMITQSPYDPNQPALFVMKGWTGTAMLRIKPTASIQQSLATLEPIFRKYNPSTPFTYQFVDEEYGRKFSDEERIGNLAAIFATLAVFISCLGLFGLASFVAEQRTKEIGIRKTMGASVANLWQLLSKDFLLLVVVACVLALPLSFWFMNDWLSHYAYRTVLSWPLFAVVALGAIAIALFTVSFQAIRAARANPVKSLRSE